MMKQKSFIILLGLELGQLIGRRIKNRNCMYNDDRTSGKTFIEVRKKTLPCFENKTYIFSIYIFSSPSLTIVGFTVE